MAAGWHALAVDLAGERDLEVKCRKLRRLEAWLAEHHRPTRLFHPDGRPIGDAVVFAASFGHAEKALAFRTLCNELGLAGRLVQWRVADGVGREYEEPRPRLFGQR